MNNIKQFLKKIPSLYSFFKFFHKTIFRMTYNSSLYWDKRYSSGGNSGVGSYGDKAIMKADVVNRWITLEDVESICEWGFGDGNQLSYYAIKGKQYVGYDVSETVINSARLRFPKNYNFFWTSDYNNETYDVSLSIEVIFHLDDSKFQNYMTNLFKSSKKYVIIFSTNYDSQPDYHMIHHEIIDYCKEHFPSFRLCEEVCPDIFKTSEINKSLNSCFFIFKRI